MAELLGNRWIQLAVVVVATAILGVAISAVIFSGEPKGPTLGPVKLTTGGTVFVTGEVGDGGGARAWRKIVEEELPLTAAQAVAAGWEDPILCSPGRGRYFQKVGQDVPYMLMYDSADDLIGIYQISNTEKSSPWQHTEEIVGGAGPIIEYEHWGLFVFFRDPVQACTISQGGCGYTAQC